MRAKVGKESGNASKKRGRPINPNSRRNKLKALRERYKRARLEYQIDEDEDDDKSINLIS